MTKARAGRRAPAAAAPRERRAEEFDRASSEHTASRGAAPRRALTPTPQRKRQRTAGRRSSGGQTPQHAAAKEAPAAGDQAAAEEQGEASITAVTEVDNDAAQGASSAVAAHAKPSALSRPGARVAHTLIGGLGGAGSAIPALASEALVISSPFGSPVKLAPPAGAVARRGSLLNPSSPGSPFHGLGLSPIPIKNFTPLSPLKAGEFIGGRISPSPLGLSSGAGPGGPAMANPAAAAGSELLDELFTAELLGPTAGGMHVRANTTTAPVGSVRQMGSLRQTTRSKAEMHRRTTAATLGAAPSGNAPGKPGATADKRRPAVWRGSLGGFGDGLLPAAEVDRSQGSKHSLDVLKLGAAATLPH